MQIDENTVAPGNSRGTRSATSEYLFRLYTRDLKDIYWAETYLADVYPGLVNNPGSEEILMVVEDHLVRTRRHVARLETVFAMGRSSIDADPGGGADLTGERVEIPTTGTLKTLARLIRVESAPSRSQDAPTGDGQADIFLASLAGSINEEAFGPSDGLVNTK